MRTSGTRIGNGKGFGKSLHGAGQGKGWGGPSLYGCGEGEGWGGPARGAGSSVPRSPFTVATPTRRTLAGQRPDPVKSAARRQVREEKVAAAERMEDVLYDLALNASNPAVQVAAACRLHDILCGPPVRRQITVEVDDVSSLSDAELAAELRKLRGF